MVYEPIDGGGRCHRIFKDSFPLGKRQIARDQKAAAFITLGEQCE
jgi:hypothetical protein